MNAFRKRFSFHLRLLWDVVDSESVVLFQILFYTMISLSGLYNLIGGRESPIEALATSTNYQFYILWVMLCLLGPLATIAGKLLKGEWSYAGLCLQLAGDVAVQVVFFTYVVASFKHTPWGQGIFAAFISVACTIGILVFIIRDVRRLKKVETNVRRHSDTPRDYRR